MTLRRWILALVLIGGAGVWAVARHDREPAPTSTAEGDSNRDDAAARYRSGHNTHWRHVVVGNHASTR